MDEKLKASRRLWIPAALTALLMVAGALYAGVMNCVSDCRWALVSAGAAAGQTAVNSSSIDMTGYYGACFIVTLGAVDATGTGTVVIAGSDNDSDFTDLTGSSVAYTATDDDKVIIIEVVNPLNRYLRCEIARSTADSTIDSIVSCQHGATKKPVTQPATVVGTDIVNGV